MINQVSIKNIVFILSSMLLSFYFAHGQSNVKQSIVGKYQSALYKYKNIKKFKEFKKDGTYKSYKISANNEEELMISGKYIVVNDSLYLECVEYHKNKILNDQILPFKYVAYKDSLRQTGMIYIKFDISKHEYYKYLVDDCWIRLDSNN